MTDKDDLILRWIAGDEEALLDGRVAPSELDAKVLDRLREVLSGVLPRAKELRLAEAGDVRCGLLLAVVPEEEDAGKSLIDRLASWVMFVAPSENSATGGELGLGMECRGFRALAAASAFLRDFPDAHVADAWGFPLLCFPDGCPKEAATPVTLNSLRAHEGKSAKLNFLFAPKPGQ